MVNVCCVSGCPGTGPHHKDTGAFFFHFPAGDPQRLAEWCERLQLGAADCEPCDLSVCERHFSPEQYDLTADCKNRLKSDAVPDRNLPRRETEPKETANTFQSSRAIGDAFNPPPVLVVDDLSKICRLCLEADEQGTHESIFTKEDIAEYITQSIGIEIDPNDGYPQMICQTCIERVTYIHRSREWFHKNDQFLKTLVGELSNEKASSSTEPTLLEGDLVKEESELALVSDANIFQSGSIEGEEVTLEQITGDQRLRLRKRRKVTLKQITVTAESVKRPGDERHRRRKQRKVPKRQKIRQAAVDQNKRRYWCRCGVFFMKQSTLNMHMMKQHAGRGLDLDPQGSLVVRSPMPANPLVLEEMAAVFNRIKPQGVDVEVKDDEVHTIEDD